MNEKILPSPALQTLFVSRETSHCPLISEMIKLGQSLKELEIPDIESGVISHDYGKRLLINAKNSTIQQLTQPDIVEIVDYDALKNVMMVIGPKDPAMETPVHWIIQKARHDINTLLQINSPSLFERFQKTLPSTENQPQPASLESAKEILKTLRGGKTILLKDKGMLVGGMNIKEINDALQKHLGGQQ